MTRALFKTLRTQLRGWLGLSPPMAGQSEQLHSTSTELDEAIQVQGGHVPYDENLLERARSQWQIGDWESLAQLNRNTLQHHPDRAKIALLAAAGRLQTGKDTEARQYIRLAQDWGVSRKLITRILVAGVHNSLGRAAALAGEQPRALQHFHSAIATGVPGGEARLQAQARIRVQCQQLNLPPLSTGTPQKAVQPVPNSIE
jgi:hypothetical protein